MSIAIREPWGLLNRLNRDLDGVWGGAPSTEVAFIPPVDVHEEKGRFVVRADLPGVKPDQIEVTAEKGVLTLRGERKAEKRENTEGYERAPQPFAPGEADNITAKFAHGVLEVEIPKQPVVAAKRVQVQTA